MIKNRRGFIRIVEASISIVIIMGVLFAFSTQKAISNDIPDYTERARDILEELSRDQELRKKVIDNSELECLGGATQVIDSGIKDFISIRIPESYLDYEIRICDVNDVCGKCSFVDKEIFSGERIISGDLNNLNPVKVKLFIWEK